VLANDLSPAACQAMRQNVDINGLGIQKVEGSEAEILPKVRVNEGDAWYGQLLSFVSFPDID
jgi:tRNA (guanine26-N2/guanine27-N2)-dimethyltransferase